jgi:hypothetical protein
MFGISDGSDGDMSGSLVNLGDILTGEPPAKCRA